MVYPDTISVYHKLRHPPDTGSERGGETPAPSSLVLDCIVISHQHRRVAARLEEDIVVYDYQAARKTAMPPFVRDMLAKTWTAQLRETARARERTWELVRAVERLERGTWDRKGAMEAWGSAAAA